MKTDWFVPIKNINERRSARAIVVAKAKLDIDLKCKSVVYCRTLQGHLARELHETAGVPWGSLWDRPDREVPGCPFWAPDQCPHHGTC